MGRKKLTGVEREPSGKVSRSQPAGVSKADLLRLVRAEPKYGTQAGMANLAKEITDDQYEQARHVARIIRDYQAALLIKGVGSPSAEQGRAGAPIDPQTAAGTAEAERQTRAIERYDRLRDRLLWRGKAICDATLKFSTDQHCEWREKEWAKVGLSQLVEDARGGNRRRGA